MVTEMNVEAERAVDLAEFAKWKGYPLPALNDDGNFDKDWLHREWVAFRAGRRRAAQPADVEAGELPPLPKDEFCAWLQHGRVANAFTHGVGDREIWDRGQYWSDKGYDRAPLFTAEQLRQYASDAIAADRRARAKEAACGS